MTIFGPYRATVAAIHDGDTIDVTIVLEHGGKIAHDVDLGFNVHRGPAGTTLERQAVRVFGCNAPELATLPGKAALAFLLSVLHVGDVVTLVSHGWDKYGGRVDGQVTLPDGRDLAQVMIAAGHAAPWDGHGPKPVPTEPLLETAIQRAEQLATGEATLGGAAEYDVSVPLPPPTVSGTAITFDIGGRR